MINRLLFWLISPVILAFGLSLEQSYFENDHFKFGDFAGILCFVIPEIVFFSFVIVTIIDSIKWQEKFQHFFRSLPGMLFMLVLISSILLVRTLTYHTDGSAFIFVEIASGMLMTGAYYFMVYSTENNGSV